MLTGISNAVKVVMIATGEKAEDLTDDGKYKAAVTLGQRGSKAASKH